MKTRKEIFSKTIKERRSNKISLQQSFQQALIIANINFSEDEYAESILKITKETVDWVEAYGNMRALQDQEPAYHNRQHFADACIALAFFLSDLDQLKASEKILLLLTMLVHDFGHEGLSSKTENQIHEARTIHLLKNSPLQKLNFLDFKLVCKLIQGTSPSVLPIAKQQYLKNPNDQFNLMQSLINDADIATSFIDSLTPELSKLILNELGNSNPSRSQIQESIEQFKNNFQLLTPTAKIYLGITN